MNGCAIADRTFWVGANDRETELFESIWPLPRAISYNAYLALGEKSCLIDTVKGNSLAAHLVRITEYLQGRSLDYLVINHIEPDHSGSIRRLRELYPGLTIVGNAKTLEFARHLYGLGDPVLQVADGQEMDLGGRRLKFFLTPMVHWPETMMTWDAQAGILFSGDAFSGFGAVDEGLFDDQTDLTHFEEEALRYFANVLGKYGVMMLRAIAKVEPLAARMICPAHGPIWRRDPSWIVSRYGRWSRQETEPGIVLAFGTMYGNTQHMLEAVTAGVHEAAPGVAVRVHDVTRSHISYILRDIWRYRGLVLGAPTYDTGLFPPMQHLVSVLQEKGLKGRTLGLFGTYGWSGGGVKAMQAFAVSAGMTVTDPVIESRFAPTADELARCRELGRNIAKAAGMPAI